MEISVRVRVLWGSGSHGKIFDAQACPDLSGQVRRIADALLILLLRWLREMMAGEDIPVPERANTVAEFVGEMRRLRSWSGLTFRQLESRAAAMGDVLPRSTLVEALKRDRLPREELLAAFVRACGAEPDTVAQWLTIRRNLAMASTGAAHQTPPDSPATAAQTASGQRPDPGFAPDAHPASALPDPVPPAAPKAARRQRWGEHPAHAVVRLGAVTAISAFVCTGGVHAQTGQAPSSPSSSQSADARHQITGAVPGRLSGRYKIKSAHSGLCLSERTPESSGQIHQLPCQAAFPPLALQAQADGTYLITPNHPVAGPGCMGVRKASTDPGAALYNDYCGDRGANLGGDRFWVEPVTTPTSGFRITLVHSKLCLGFASGQAREGAPLLQQPCDTAAPHQVFLLASP
ncbi:XRE family transcriptional regulator [Thermomonospora cellulosilytica]|uniref:XRE family transcriptional regulator n=1 Tax=Thermomonospora cellulosilytica TaxID=1411118 RepID=A0A7W3N1B8_9ACTN|nr:XRE family transcriptional regulator [Thermomonospora cellulosilytica]MBA9005740.1 hypothetical protein [Thermomonospora cellulosilytica]